MKANIVVKLNNGQAYAYAGLNVKDFWIGINHLVVTTDHETAHWMLHQIKEILIKPMPTPSQIAIIPKDLLERETATIRPI